MDSTLASSMVMYPCFKKTVWRIHTMGYYVAHRKKETLTYAAAQVHLEDRRLRERSRTKGQILNNPTSVRNLTQADSRGMKGGCGS